MNINSLPYTKDQHESIDIGPLKEQQYKALSDHLKSLAIGFSASRTGKNEFIISTSSRQLLRGGIVLETK